MALPAKRDKGKARGEDPIARLAREDVLDASAARRSKLAALEQTIHSTGDVTTELEAYYTIEEILGKGTFGSVYKCQSKASMEHVAVKAVDIAKLDHAKVDRILYEVGIMKLLTHPNVVQLKRVMRSDKHIFIVMELCNAELLDRIEERGTFSEKDACKIMKSLLSAVAYLHSQKIAHRDIKPQNILMVADSLSDIKLSDFGLSKQISSHPMSTQCGTPAYMAPEVIGDEPYDEKCDLWSCGVLLYLLLSGTLPFPQQEFDDVREAVRRGKYPRPAVSDSSRDLINRLLAVNPRERYSAVEALKHPWIEGREASEAAQPTLFSMLISFKAQQRWKLAVNTVVAVETMRSRARSRLGSPAGSPLAGRSPLSSAPASSSDDSDDDGPKRVLGDRGTGRSATLPSPLATLPVGAVARPIAAKGAVAKSKSVDRMATASPLGSPLASSPLNTSGGSLNDSMGLPRKKPSIKKMPPPPKLAPPEKSERDVPSYMKSTSASKRKNRAPTGPGAVIPR